MLSLILFFFRYKLHKEVKNLSRTTASGIRNTKRITYNKLRMAACIKLLTITIPVDLFAIFLIIAMASISNPIDNLKKSNLWLQTLTPEQIEEMDYDWSHSFKEREELAQDIVDNANANGASSDEAKRLVEVALNEYNTRGNYGGQDYRDWMDSILGTLSGGKYAWCATFVTWCANEAGLFVESSGDSSATFGSLKDSYSWRSCRGWINYAAKMNWKTYKSTESDYIPQPGDLVVFYKPDGGGTVPVTQHIGIVYEYTSDKHVWTVEGNTSGGGHSSGVLNIKDRGKQALSNGYWSYAVYIHPNYKVVEQKPIDWEVKTGNFDLGRYTKGSDGYYSQDTVKQIVYDFLIQECGFNSAAACGALGNLQSECGFKYDVLEAANFGKVYKRNSLTNSLSDIGLVAPSSSYQGNYDPNDSNSVIYYSGDDIYYKKKAYKDEMKWSYHVDSNGDKVYHQVKYGGGYGLVQWSFGRRIKLVVTLAKSSDWVYGPTCGPDSLMSQLMYMKQELESSYKNSVLIPMQNVSNTEAGARKAAEIWVANYEIPGGLEAAKVVRGNQAVAFWNNGFGNKIPTGS